MKLHAKVSWNDTKNVRYLMNAFFKEFNPESSIFIKGNTAEVNVVFEEPPFATVDAIGTIEIENAKEIIRKEADSQSNKNPKNNFVLTKHQKEKQILMQIKTAIMEQTDKYIITNPEEMVINLEQLCGGEKEQAVRTVVKNLIRRKEFETAKIICNKFYGNSNQNYVKILRNEIRNAEIGDIVLRVIKMETSIEEEGKCFELIQKGLKKGNINLSAISLGKSKDGTINISLEDIWEDENTKSK